MLVRDSLTWAEIKLPPEAKVLGAEIAAIDIYPERDRPCRVINMYLPPEKTRGFQWCRLDKLIEKDNLVVCTDSNVHHPAWDPLRKADAAGKRLHEWLCKNDLQVFNDGAVTRISGSLRSTPDVTFGRTAVPTQLRPHQRQR